MNGDGSQQHQLTNIPGGACQPSWAPDGMRLVFTSPCSGKADTFEGSALYIFNLSDNQVTALPASLEGDFDPAWSPTGKVIAFTSLRNGKPSIFSINLEMLSVQALSKDLFNDR